MTTFIICDGPSDVLMCVCCVCSAGGAVGMRETVYQFSENGGVATVCVGVQGTASGCVIPFPISMTLTTIHVTGTLVVVLL